MFGNMGGYPSVADIASVFNGGGRNSDDGWGGNGGWWILIILLAMWGGFGGNWGNNGGRSMNSDFTDAAVQRGFDNQAVINKLNGIENGLCSLGYDQLAQMNNISTNILQTGNVLQQAINADTVANMQNTNTLSRQVADCCCKQENMMKDLQYTIAQNDCATRTQIHETGDAIIQNQNWNFRDLNDTVRDGFAAIEKRDLMRENAQLQQQVNNAQRQAEFSQWANYITGYLAPKTNPAYLSCNPQTGMVIPDHVINQIACQVAQQLNGCDCNSGCYTNRCC